MQTIIKDWIDRIHVGDSLEILKRIPDGSVNLVITSPPYFLQRRYTDDRREIGREDEIGDYLDNLYGVFLECVRVTRDDGSIVVNVGDKYIEGNLMLIPYDFARMVRDRQAATLINDVTWAKTNPTPRQYDRRMVGSTEPFFHFVKTGRYNLRFARIPGWFWESACDLFI